MVNNVLYPVVLTLPVCYTSEMH